MDGPRADSAGCVRLTCSQQDCWLNLTMHMLPMARLEVTMISMHASCSGRQFSPCILQVLVFQAHLLMLLRTADVLLLLLWLVL